MTLDVCININLTIRTIFLKTPVESLSAICRNSEIKSVLATGIDHQGDYDVSSRKDIKDWRGLQFTLRAIVKMVREIPIP